MHPAFVLGIEQPRQCSTVRQPDAMVMGLALILWKRKGNNPGEYVSRGYGAATVEVKLVAKPLFQFTTLKSTGAIRV